MVQQDENVWCSSTKVSMNDKQTNNDQDQIRFLDCSFFPVQENVCDLFVEIEDLAPRRHPLSTSWEKNELDQDYPPDHPNDSLRLLGDTDRNNNNHGVNVNDNEDVSLFSSLLETMEPPKNSSFMSSTLKFQAHRSKPSSSALSFLSPQTSPVTSSPQQQPPKTKKMLRRPPASTKQLADDRRFKPYHKENWQVRYQEFAAFVDEHGHGAVPHTYPKNQQLARWVKRQRHQYKLHQEGKSSTMTKDRIHLLASAGFVWDSHEINWKEKIAALKQFHNENGHFNVPAKHRENKLGTWVKCQRRQHKLFCEGKSSSMTPQRIAELEQLGFEWEVRNGLPVRMEFVG